MNASDWIFVLFVMAFPTVGVVAAVVVAVAIWKSQSEREARDEERRES